MEIARPGDEPHAERRRSSVVPQLLQEDADHGMVDRHVDQRELVVGRLRGPEHQFLAVGERVGDESGAGEHARQLPRLHEARSGDQCMARAAAAGEEPQRRQHIARAGERPGRLQPDDGFQRGHAQAAVGRLNGQRQRRRPGALIQQFGGRALLGPAPERLPRLPPVDPWAIAYFRTSVHSPNWAAWTTAALRIQGPIQTVVVAAGFEHRGQVEQAEPLDRRAPAHGRREPSGRMYSRARASGVQRLATHCRLAASHCHRPTLPLFAPSDRLLPGGRRLRGIDEQPDGLGSIEGTLPVSCFKSGSGRLAHRRIALVRQSRPQQAERQPHVLHLAENLDRLDRRLRIGLLDDGH